MTDQSDISIFEDGAINRLIGPINDYYDYIEISDTKGRRNIAMLRVRADIQRTLRELHTEAAVLGNDGTLTAEERVQLTDIVVKDQDYMQGFLDSLPTLSRSEAVSRTYSYLSTIINTYNIFAVMDLPELPMMPKDPELECCSRGFPACKCRLRVVRLGNSSWNVYWDLDAKESCADCIRLNQEWRPLQIRGGIVQSTKELPLEEMRDHIRHIKSLIAVATWEAEHVRF